MAIHYGISPPTGLLYHTVPKFQPAAALGNRLTLRRHGKETKNGPRKLSRGPVGVHDWSLNVQAAGLGVGSSLAGSASGSVRGMIGLLVS